MYCLRVAAQGAPASQYLNAYTLLEAEQGNYSVARIADLSGAGWRRLPRGGPRNVLSLTTEANR